MLLDCYGLLIIIILQRKEADFNALTINMPISDLKLIIYTSHSDLNWYGNFNVYIFSNQSTFDDHILSSEKCQRDVNNLVIYVIRTCAYINCSRDNLIHRIILGSVMFKQFQ